MKNCFQSAAAGKNASVFPSSRLCVVSMTLFSCRSSRKKKKWQCPCKHNFNGRGGKKKKKSKGTSPAKAKSRVFKDLLHSQAELRQRLMHRTALEVVAAAAAAAHPAASSAGWPLQSDKFIVNHAQLSRWMGEVSIPGEWDGRQKGQDGRNKDLGFSDFGKEKDFFFLALGSEWESRQRQSGRQEWVCCSFSHFFL